MPRTSLLSFTVLLIFLSLSVIETEPNKRKKPTRAAVSKTDPMLSMNNKKNKKLTKIKKKTSGKKG